MAYGNFKDYNDLNLIDYEKMAHKRLKNFKDKIHWIRKKSSDAAKEIPNNLDFVYIDGNHAYEFIKNDLETYYPKLKEGGFLAGHDFYKTNGDQGPSYNGVLKAVTEFAVNNNLELYSWFEDWWIIKSFNGKHGK